MSTLRSTSRAAVIRTEDRAFLAAVGRLAFANPFTEEGATAEREARDLAFLGARPENRPVATAEECGAQIAARLRPVLEHVRARLEAGAVANDADLVLYEEGCHYALNQAHAAGFQALVERRAPANAASLLQRAFAGDYEHFFHFARSPLHPPAPTHLFACGFQVQRALHYLSAFLQGRSRPARALRADVLRSIFTDDMRAYVRHLYDRVSDIPTLVTGPTGTGKELAAQAIGFSRYLPWDPKTEAFAAEYDDDYHPLNLAVMAPTLLESELFGHHRGAFTGAVQDQRGFLDCGRWSTLFLDEIGEADLSIQVKLLRVLQTREFHPVGSRDKHQLSAHIVAATHRDLEARIAEGAFREDFFYRISSDWIVTPSLRAQLDDTPEDLGRLLRFIARKVAGDEQGEALAVRTERWIEQNLPRAYAWPGNVRELEGCVRSMMMRGHCRKPKSLLREPSPPREAGADDELLREIRERTFSLDQVVRRYVTLLVAETSNIEETARRLGVNRHSVAAKIDRVLLAKLTRARPALTERGKR